MFDPAQRVGYLRAPTLHNVMWAVLLAFSAPAMANPITLGAASGNRSASATFADNAGTLTVTLTNTSTHDVLEPVEILTAVYFDSTVPLDLTRVSATLGGGSTVLFGGTDPGNSVGGEWAYKSGLSGAPGGLTNGISSSGLGLFGPGDRFPGNNLQGPDEPDGLQYGITAPLDNPATGNQAVTGGNALIQNSVVFVLTGLPAGFDPSTQISAAIFQYGTALGEPTITNVPEPVTIVFLGLGAALMVRRRRSA